MDSSQAADQRIQVTRDYFRLADQGRREVLELFHEEAEREDGTAFGVAQLLVAGTGLVLAAVAVVESAPDCRRPWRWLVAAAVAYVVWVGLLVSAIR